MTTTGNKLQSLAHFPRAAAAAAVTFYPSTVQLLIIALPLFYFRDLRHGVAKVARRADRQEHHGDPGPQIQAGVEAQPGDLGNQVAGRR